MGHSRRERPYQQRIIVAFVVVAASPRPRQKRLETHTTHFSAHRFATFLRKLTFSATAVGCSASRQTCESACPVSQPIRQRNLVTACKSARSGAPISGHRFANLIRKLTFSATVVGCSASRQTCENACPVSQPIRQRNLVTPCESVRSGRPAFWDALGESVPTTA